ncbi:MAG: hypothetical protein AB7O04_01810 [Hyphomonadaceae bacterium]
MTDFDLDLKRAFATQEDPADDGFAVAVAGRVSRRERTLQVRKWAGVGAFTVAGGAFGFAVISLIQGLGPSLMAQFGLDLAVAHGALANGSALSALAAGLTPLLLAAAAGVGGLAVARTLTDD